MSSDREPCHPDRVGRTTGTQVEVNLFAKPALGSNAHAVAHDQHPDHQCRVDRGSPRPTVEGLQSLTKAVEVEVSIDAPQQMIGRDMVIEAKVVKQPSLGRLNPHHRRLSRIRQDSESRPSLHINRALTFQRYPQMAVMRRRETPGRLSHDRAICSESVRELSGCGEC
jgi:hypothetical protein